MVYRCIRQDSVLKEDLQKTLNCMTPERRAHIERITHPDVRLATLCGEWLCKVMLSEQSGMAFEQICLTRRGDGKPEAQNLPLHFNVSHSGDFVACAVSRRPVGIDLEVLKTRDLSVAKRICSEKELAFIAPEKPDALHRFLKVWTAKEAYVKLSGIGIKAMAEADYFALQERLVCIEKDGYILSVIK